jgi:hypothetical protein
MNSSLSLIDSHHQVVNTSLLFEAYMQIDEVLTPTNRGANPSSDHDLAIIRNGRVNKYSNSRSH